MEAIYGAYEELKTIVNMNTSTIIVALCSLFFLVIGADKFLGFLGPSCSLMDSISPNVWKFAGALQMTAGILIWLPTFRKYVAGLFLLFMLVSITNHLLADTYDIGGAVFMVVMLGLLLWNPSFLRGGE